MGNPFQKWGLILTMVAALAVAVVFSYQSVQQSKHEVALLNNEDLPLFTQIQHLQTSLVEIESTVYRFYVTTNMEEFTPQFMGQISYVDQLLATLSTKVSDSDELKMLTEVKQAMVAAGIRFKHVMINQPVDWSEARTALAEFSPLIKQANQHSANLNQWVRQQVTNRSEASANRLENTLWFFSILTLLTILAALQLARSNQNRLAALREQQRMASFPQRNPNPVLSVDSDGKILYSNPSAVRVAKELSNNKADSQILLPDGLIRKLDHCTDYHLQEIEVEGRDFQVGIHWLEDFAEYHAYLSDITARKNAERHLEYLAYHDSLTDLPNRHQFSTLLDEALLQPRQNPMVALMDIDKLHRVITLAGQSAGDKLVVEASQRLSAELKRHPCGARCQLAHLNNGLFALSSDCSAQETEQLLETLCRQMTDPFQTDGYEFFLSLTIGLASLEQHKGGGEEAMRFADTALSIGKQQGGNQIVHYSAEMERLHRSRIDIENGLQHAVENSELVAFYQPKLSLSSGRIVGAEALLRWNRGHNQMVSPADFIPIAEESGQIVELGNWILKQACLDALKWNEQSDHPVSVAVNLSTKQLLHGDIVEQVSNTLAETGLAANLLELEITESAALSDFEATIEQLNALHALGIKLSLDDFGTGFSSLSYLHRLPVQTLKVDQSFIRYLDSDSTINAITQSVINLGHKIGLNIVAEGVETEQHREQLLAWHCDHIQGYLFSRPLPNQQFVTFFEEHQKAPTIGDQS